MKVDVYQNKVIVETLEYSDIVVLRDQIIDFLSRNIKSKYVNFTLSPEETMHNIFNSGLHICVAGKLEYSIIPSKGLNDV